MVKTTDVDDLMPLDDLTQALEAQKFAGIETDALDVIAQALEVDRALLNRVIYAYEALRNEVRDSPLRGDFPTASHSDAALLPDAELRDAIRKAMGDGAMRLTVRYAIQNSKTLTVLASLLVPPQNISKICDGCPERIECIAENLSTPEKCLTGKHRRIQVYPLRMTKTRVEVEAAQPAGRYTIPLSHLFRMR